MGLPAAAGFQNPVPKTIPVVKPNHSKERA
jgi:hypothetical protein